NAATTTCRGSRERSGHLHVLRGAARGGSQTASEGGEENQCGGDVLHGVNSHSLPRQLVLEVEGYKDREAEVGGHVVGERRARLCPGLLVTSLTCWAVGAHLG